MKLVITLDDLRTEETVELLLPAKPSERLIYRTVSYAEQLAEQLNFSLDRHELIYEMTIGREYAQDHIDGPNKFQLTLTV